MSGPRVLFVQGAAVRAGAESALLGRLRHLPDHGIEPVVAFLAQGPFRDEVERTGVRTVALDDAPHVRELTRLPGAVRRLAELARRERVDVIEACGEKMALLAGWSARLAGCGCVYNLQDAPRRTPGVTAIQLLAVLGRHDEVVVPSRWMARAFRPLGLRPRAISNAVVLDELPERAADVRAPAGWPAGATVAGMFGRLVAWKGAEVFLKAARRALERDPAVRFLVAGGTLYGREPDHHRRLRALADELGIGDRVYFAGHRDDALALMAGCDLVCHCSVEPEPFGMVVLEAMALGRPVIATRTRGPEELIEHGRTGLLVAPGDDAGLADEILSLAADPDARARLGSAARELVERRYSSRALSGELSELYRGVAERRRR